jgi:hypothetical protein
MVKFSDYNTKKKIMRKTNFGMKFVYFLMNNYTY